MGRRTLLKSAVKTFGAVAVGSLLTLSAAHAAVGEPEKEERKFGFIKLTDMAPLAIAYEKGYFEDEGLYVQLEAQANWKVLLDRVIDGQLDGAHMLAGQPLGATIGFGTQAHIITAFSMDLNGNAITVSNEIWEQMKPYVDKDADGKPVHPIKADALKPVADAYKPEGKPVKMDRGFPVYTHKQRAALLAGSRGNPPGLLCSAERRHCRTDRCGCPAFGDPAATDAFHHGSRNDLWLLRRRAMESASRI